MEDNGKVGKAIADILVYQLREGGVWMTDEDWHKLLEAIRVLGVTVKESDSMPDNGTA